ncbi:transposable element Tcb1 transposase [Trichonephila clavipes]|nr:transposable element Tcb1 transposase [Trichonephila clavipes]
MKKCLTAGFELITSNCKSLKEVVIGLKEAVGPPLAVIRGTLTAYVDDILRTVLLPFLLQYPDLIFQQHNARPDTSRVAMHSLTACPTLPWAARSLSNRACLG